MFIIDVWRSLHVAERENILNLYSVLYIKKTNKINFNEDSY